MKRKKILFLIHTLQVGGAEKVLVNLVNKLDKTKYDITVMTVINTGAFREQLSSNVRYDSIIKLNLLNKIVKLREKSKDNSNKSGNLFSKKSYLKKLLARIYKFFWRHVNLDKLYTKVIKDRYDVEIAFLEGVSAKIISHSSNALSKKIAWIHVDMINETKTEGFFKNTYEERNTYNKFDLIVSVSKVVRRQFIKKFEFNEDKVIVRYNPIDRENIEKLSKEIVKDICKDKFTLCSIGRLSKQKGYDRLIRTVKKLNEDGFEFDLWIIGVGLEEGTIKKYIQENNISNIKLLGYKSNPYKYIKISDLYVCSSRAEGFSTSVAEAMILEKPVIVTKCSGMIELVGKNNEYGLMCENNEEQLYHSIKSVLNNKELYNYYVEKVKNRKEIFDLKKVITCIEELF